MQLHRLRLICSLRGMSGNAAEKVVEARLEEEAAELQDIDASSRDTNSDMRSSQQLHGVAMRTDNFFLAQNVRGKLVLRRGSCPQHRRTWASASLPQNPACKHSGSAGILPQIQQVLIAGSCGRGDLIDKRVTKRENGFVRRYSVLYLKKKMPLNSSLALHGMP